MEAANRSAPIQQIDMARFMEDTSYAGPVHRHGVADGKESLQQAALHQIIQKLADQQQIKVQMQQQQEQQEWRQQEWRQQQQQLQQQEQEQQHQMQLLQHLQQMQQAQQHSAEQQITQQLQKVQGLVQQQQLLQQRQMQQQNTQQPFQRQQREMRWHEEPYQHCDQRRATHPELEHADAMRMTELVSGLQRHQAEQSTNNKMMRINQMQQAMAAERAQPTAPTRTFERVQPALDQPTEEEIQELLHMAKLQKQLIQQQAAFDAQPGYVLDAAGLKRKQLIVQIKEQLEAAMKKIPQEPPQPRPQSMDCPSVHPVSIMPRDGGAQSPYQPSIINQADAQSAANKDKLPLGCPPGLEHCRAARNNSAITDGCLPQMNAAVKPSRSHQASHTEGYLPDMSDFQAPGGQSVPASKFTTRVRVEAAQFTSHGSSSSPDSPEEDMSRWGAPPGLEHCRGKRNLSAGYHKDVNHNKDWSDDDSTMSTLPMFSAHALASLNTLNTLPDMKTFNTLPDMGQTANSLPELTEQDECKYLDATP
jgi:hypothetical protein